MIDLSSLLESAVEQSRPLGQGTSGAGTVLTWHRLADGREIVTKEAREAFEDLEREARMLGRLSEAGAPVPTVWHAAPRLLVMDYLPDGGPMTARAEEAAADALAALHQVRAAQYGFDEDTLIGPLRQPNPWTENWHDFFHRHRLIYMARLAVEKGRLPTADLSRVEDLREKLPDLLGPAAPPALIHGDLWGGNVMVGEDGLSGFIDPAIYFADPEIDLAYTTLFGTFSRRFYDRYAEVAGLREGFFEVRRDLYNLYPLLVHTRLFGGGYAGQVSRLLDRFVG